MSTLGDIITINLTTRQITRLPIGEDVARQYMGGRGLNIWQMQQQANLDVDPFGPDNELLLSNGLLTGTVAPSSSRVQLAARSPQTGFLGTSNVGGHFGAALRRVGVQMVCVIGQSPAPVYLWIDGEKTEILDASSVWGLDVPAAVDAVKARHPDHPDLHFFGIGVGGENKVRFAAVIADDGHAAGRTGLGAVMGAKNLKAFVVPATPGSRSNNAELSDLAKDYAREIRASERYDIYSTYSNGVYLRETNDLGLLGTRNFQQVQFEKTDQINGADFMKYVHKHKTCHRCPVHCKAEVRIEHGRFEKLIGERPDIEPLMGFGPRIGVADLEAVLYMFNLTNTLGIDSISAAGVIAFAMDLYEQEIISVHDTGGMPLRWGDVESAIVLLNQIARREGFGDVLAEGVLRAAKKIGPDALPLAHHCKGLELPGYDPRSAQGSALAFAISSRGADYASVYPSLEWFWTPEQGKAAFGSEDSVNPLKPEGKGRMVKHSYMVSAALDALGVCKVPVLSVLGDFSLEHETRLAAAYTGWFLTPADLFQLGAEIITGERRLNIAFGLTSADDQLSSKFLNDPAPSGPGQGMVVQLDPMLRDYYQAMGWDENGIPR